MLKLGLDQNKIDLIKSIEENVDISCLEELKRIGIWTINSLKIKMGEKDIFLYEDLRIIYNDLENILKFYSV